MLAERGQPLRYNAFVQILKEEFRVSTRTCKDAIGVLHDAGYVDTTPIPSDGRARLYTINERGQTILDHPAGATILRYARKLFSTNASKRTRRQRYARTGGLNTDEALQRLETLFLSGEYAELVRSRIASAPPS